MGIPQGAGESGVVSAVAEALRGEAEVCRFLRAVAARDQIERRKSVGETPVRFWKARVK
jgi:hypothetical protein